MSQDWKKKKNKVEYGWEAPEDNRQPLQKLTLEQDSGKSENRTEVIQKTVLMQQDIWLLLYSPEITAINNHSS